MNHFKILIDAEFDECDVQVRVVKKEGKCELYTVEDYEPPIEEALCFIAGHGIYYKLKMGETCSENELEYDFCVKKMSRNTFKVCFHTHYTPKRPGETPPPPYEETTPRLEFVE
jgi:hypothetical protein